MTTDHITETLLTNSNIVEILIKILVFKIIIKNEDTWIGNATTSIVIAE